MCTVDEMSVMVTKATSVKVDRRNPLALALKRVIDLIGSTTLLLLTWPVFLVIALAIKLDSPGPVYFRRRVGRAAWKNHLTYLNFARWWPTLTACY